MRVLLKRLYWLIQVGDTYVEMETSEDGKELFWVKPLNRPIGLVFYLNV